MAEQMVNIRFHRRVRPSRQRVIVRQLMLLQELKRDGHLFEIIYFGPLFISRPLAAAQPLLNVDNEIDAPGRGGSLLGKRGDRARSGDDRPDVLGAKTIAQRTGPEPGCLVLPRREERHHAAAPMFDRVLGLFHQHEERGKIGGAFLQSLHNGGAELRLE